LDFAGSGPQEIIPLETLDSTELDFERFSNFVEENSNSGQPWSSGPETVLTTLHSHQEQEDPVVPLPQPLPVNQIIRARYGNVNDTDQQSSSLDEDMDVYDPTDMTSDSSGDEDSNQMTSTSKDRRHRKQPSSFKKKGAGGGKVKVKDNAVNFVTNPSERKVRFILGIYTIFIKTKRMENQTGSKCIVKALYENHEYAQEDVEEFLRNFKKGHIKSSTAGAESCIEDIETSRPTSEELEDDHRYAATILTQKVSSTGLHDHQYNEVSTSSGRTKRMKIAWYQEHGSTKGNLQPNPQPFIKNKSQRERTLCQFLDTTYPKIKRIETRTNANIEFSVIYENLIFTSQNYTKAKGILRKNKVRVLRPRVPHVTATVTRIPENLTAGTPNTLYVQFQHPLSILPMPSPTESNVISITELESHSTPASSFPTIVLEPEPDRLPMTPPSPAPMVETISETPRVSATSTTTENIPSANGNSEVICRKCSRNVSPHEEGGGRRQVTWIRCADALCQYMVHSACIGFYVHHPRDLRRLPPFYCETHRDWD